LTLSSSAAVTLAPRRVWLPHVWAAKRCADAQRGNARADVVQPGHRRYRQKSFGQEVDALGGAMASATDRGGIQFRVLNASKGPAVRATRAQADRVLYKAAIRSILENQTNLTISTSCRRSHRARERVEASSRKPAFVFLPPLWCCAPELFSAAKSMSAWITCRGPRRRSASIALAQRLRELPLRVDRLKTGTRRASMRVR